MDAQYFLKKNPPWTSLLGTGRLLVFHFLSSIKDLEPQLSQMDDSESIPIVYFELSTIPPWTVIRPWMLINFESFFHPGRLLGHGRLFGT